MIMTLDDSSIDYRNVGIKAYNTYLMKKCGINIVNGFVVYNYLDNNDIDFLNKNVEELLLYAVRSSMGDEDDVNLSSAGKYLSLLGVKKEELVEAINEVFNQANECSNKAVLIQPMIYSEVAGVLFTQNPVTGSNTMLINAGLGIGENVVSGSIDPDEYELSLDNKKIIHQNIKVKHCVFTYGENLEPATEVRFNNHRMRVTISNENKLLLSVHFQDVKKSVLTDEQLWELAHTADKIRGIFNCEVDIEFAIYNGTLFILQARPITSVIENLSSNKEKITSTDREIIGQKASNGSFCGKVIKINNENTKNKIPKDSNNYVLLVLEMYPELMYNFTNIGAIITAKGGVLSHAAIVAREKGIPCVVGIEESYDTINDGDIVLVDANDGRVIILDEII